MEEKQVPVGVKVISVFDWIFAVLLILGGILSIGLGLLFLGTSKATGFGLIPGFTGSLVQSMLYGILILALGVFLIFVAIGLQRGRNWTRIVHIILAFIGIGLAIWGLIKLQFGNIFGLAINGLIAGYLLFSNKVKEAFS